MTALKHFRSKSEGKADHKTCKQARVNDEFDITASQVRTIIGILRTIANAKEDETVDIPELSEATPEEVEELVDIARSVFPKEVEPEGEPEGEFKTPAEPTFTPEEGTFRRKSMQSKKEAQSYTPSFLKLMTTKF